MFHDRRRQSVPFTANRDCQPPGQVRLEQHNPSVRSRGCTLFRGAHDSDTQALRLQAWAHLYKAFTDIGATPEEFLEYLQKNGLAKGDACGEVVVGLLESMLQMIGDKRIGLLPNGRYLAVYAAGTRQSEAGRKEGGGSSSDRQRKDRG